MLIRFLAIVMLVAAAVAPTNDVYAYGCGPHGCYGPTGVGRGAFGAVRPAWYGPVGRFPKLGFGTPLRPWGGFTPVRQFLFGRGHFRRMNRRAVLFGGRRVFGRRCFSC